ncbi:tRNA pseudouridine synthase A [Sulfolobus sp. S-194]|uniref:tRNA pseudouridine synthase A n=1 Tax=Sulfolobus sp. S-194 TaxID=2512240 RepID=UPI0014373BA2|nr:tRNA pseudouridine synthase A [Sulfolobus sp. S-194]QIW23248.1 tRNA pseudouridine synthase A [Sulfolobus sp. S-194]
MQIYGFIYKIDSFCNYSNSWIILQDSYTDEKYGYFADKRPIEVLIKNSIINVDKPPGPTSHEVAFWIKQMFKVSKAGHGGTLEL